MKANNGKSICKKYKKLIKEKISDSSHKHFNEQNLKKILNKNKSNSCKFIDTYSDLEYDVKFICKKIESKLDTREINLNKIIDMHHNPFSNLFAIYIIQKSDCQLIKISRSFSSVIEYKRHRISCILSEVTDMKYFNERKFMIILSNLRTDLINLLVILTKIFSHKWKQLKKTLLDKNRSEYNSKISSYDKNLINFSFTSYFFIPCKLNLFNHLNILRSRSGYDKNNGNLIHSKMKKLKNTDKHAHVNSKDLKKYVNDTDKSNFSSLDFKSNNEIKNFDSNIIPPKMSRYNNENLRDKNLNKNKYNLQDYNNSKLKENIVLKSKFSYRNLKFLSNKRKNLHLVFSLPNQCEMINPFFKFKLIVKFKIIKNLESNLNNDIDNSRLNDNFNGENLKLSLIPSFNNEIIAISKFVNFDKFQDNSYNDECHLSNNYYKYNKYLKKKTYSVICEYSNQNIIDSIKKTNRDSGYLNSDYNNQKSFLKESNKYDTNLHQEYSSNIRNILKNEEYIKKREKNKNQMTEEKNSCLILDENSDIFLSEKNTQIRPFLTEEKVKNLCTITEFKSTIKDKSEIFYILLKEIIKENENFQIVF